MSKFSLALFALLMLIIPVKSQSLADQLIPLDSVKADTFPIDESIMGIDLPAVGVFLEAARSYADVKYYEAKLRENELLLKISRKEWLKYFRVQGNYQYGTTNSLLTESADINPNEVRFRGQTQDWYNIGVTLAIPLDDIFNRKNRNDVARARVDQSKYEQATSLEKRQMIILEAYNEVVKNLELLKINAESVALYDAQMRISEKDFSNGRIDIITLSLERGRRSEANIKYQTSRAALNNAVSILELLTQIKIIKK